MAPKPTLNTEGLPWQICKGPFPHPPLDKQSGFKTVVSGSQLRSFAALWNTTHTSSNSLMDPSCARTGATYRMCNGRKNVSGSVTNWRNLLYVHRRLLLSPHPQNLWAPNGLPWPASPEGDGNCITLSGRVSTPAISMDMWNLTNVAAIPTYS